MKSNLTPQVFSISLLIQYLERDIVNLKKQKSEALKTAEQDYDYFFRWYVDTLMANELKLRYFEWIKEQIIKSKGTKADVIDLLNFFISDIDRQLSTFGTNILNSTSSMSNIHNVLKIQNWFNIKEYIKYFMDYVNSFQEQ